MFLYINYRQSNVITIVCFMEVCYAYNVDIPDIILPYLDFQVVVYDFV